MNCGQFLAWISLHEYWDMMTEDNTPADYEACMAFTDRIKIPTMMWTMKTA